MKKIRPKTALASDMQLSEFRNDRLVGDDVGDKQLIFFAFNPREKRCISVSANEYINVIAFNRASSVSGEKIAIVNEHSANRAQF